MTTMAATEAKNRFGELLEAVHRAPVEISKSGRTVAVVLSIEDYEEMKRQVSKRQAKPDFTGLESWIERTRVTRRGKALDKADYYQHLDEKYGS